MKQRSRPMTRRRTLKYRALGACIALGLMLWGGQWAFADRINPEPTEEEALSAFPAATIEEEESTGERRLSVYDEIEVRERVDDLVGVAQSASEGSTGRGALEDRPIQRSGEIVETVPGLIATQHSGDGKANPVLPARLQPRPRNRLFDPRRRHADQPAEPWARAGVRRLELPDSGTRGSSAFPQRGSPRPRPGISRLPARPASNWSTHWTRESSS